MEEVYFGLQPEELEPKKRAQKVIFAAWLSAVVVVVVADEL
jgi:hypothetical protein